MSRIDEKKILVVYCMDHKYFIDDHLDGLAREIKVAEWFDPIRARSFQFSDALKSKILMNLESSKRRLQERLCSTGKSATFSEKLQAKLPQFDLWIEHVTNL